MSKVLVIGCGVSGKAVINFCLNRGDEVVCVDRDTKKQASYPIFAEDHLFSPFDFDLVVVSPGVKLSHPQVVVAQKERVRVIGEVELALEQVSNKAIGITGTNGKSTCVTLIAHILNYAGKRAHTVGNIGNPIISMIKNIDPGDILVIELSSFQLMTMKKRSLDVGVILNITPDHIDWHETFDAYSKAKLHIKELIKPGGMFLFPIGNFEAARKICKTFGVSENDIDEAIDTFEPLEHRMEYVTTIDGIRCVNDSKATNIGSLEYALDKTKGDIVLICGGINKGVSMAPLAKHIDEKCRAVVLIGESKNVIASQLAKETNVVFAETLREAVQKGLQHAARGDTLLLAPGCSSFDMFDNYMARGKEFKKVVTKGHHYES